MKNKSVDIAVHCLCNLLDLRVVLETNDRFSPSLPFGGISGRKGFPEDPIQFLCLRKAAPYDGVESARGLSSEVIGGTTSLHTLEAAGDER